MNNNKSVLYLFTNNYPFKGFEYFIDNEIKYLAEEFDEIKIFPYPEYSNTEKYFNLPENATVHLIAPDESKSIKQLILSHFIQIIQWWLHEFVISKHRLKYISQFKWNINRLIGLIKLSDSLKKENIPDNAVLYSYWFNEWVDVLAWSKCTWLKKEFIARAHGYDFDEDQTARGYHPFRHVVFRKIKRVYQISEYGKSYMSKQGLDESKIEVIRLGVSDNGLGVIPAEKYIIVTCSNLYPIKRLHLMPDILNHLNVPYKWVHFGGGNFEEEMLTIIHKKISAANFEFKGVTPNAEILEFYSKSGADVVMNVSKLEGIPVSLMEAISFGIPVTGCNICGVPEIVNENTGILYNVQFDPKEVANNLEKMLLEKSRNVEFRKGVREYYMKNFKSEVNFPQFIKQIKIKAI